MSERGTIAIDRGLFGHGRFADEPFTEREAWIWMIGQAAFRPHCKVVGSVRVTLRRGEFAHSIRFMADKWQWSPTTVRRYLERLATDIDGDGTMIGTRSDTGITVVSIRNYDAYQPKLFPDDPVNGAENGTAAAQQRHKEESLAKNVVVDGERAPPSKSVFLDEDLAVGREALQAMGDEPEGPRQITMAYQAAMWRERGIPRAEILATFAEIADKAEKFPLSYYIAAVNARGRRNRERPPPQDQPHLPLRPVVISSTEPSHETASPHQPASDWRGSRDAFRAARAELSAFVEAADDPGGDCGEGGRPIVQTPSAA